MASGDYCYDDAGSYWGTLAMTRDDPMAGDGDDDDDNDDNDDDGSDCGCGSLLICGENETATKIEQYATGCENIPKYGITCYCYDLDRILCHPCGN